MDVSLIDEEKIFAGKAPKGRGQLAPNQTDGCRWLYRQPSV